MSVDRTSTPPNNRLKLTRGDGASHASGAHARASRARGIVSRRAQLKRARSQVLDGHTQEGR